VISSNPEAYALVRARENGIPGYSFKKTDYASPQGREADMFKTLEKYAPDYIVLAGFLGIFTPEFVGAFPDRIINIHPSLLPDHGGAGMYGIRVHESVLRRGDAITGATVHFVDEGTDTGQIILQKIVLVDNISSAEELQRKVLEEAEHPLLCEAVALLCDGSVRTVNGKVIVER